jgi:hypothetical protein
MPQGRACRSGITVGISASLCLLVGCAQDPVTLIPEGFRTVLKHEIQFASRDHQSISVDQMLARARRSPTETESAASSEAASAADDAGTPAVTAGPGASSDAVASANEWRPDPQTTDAPPEMVSLGFAIEGPGPAMIEEVDRVRLRATVDRLPPSVEWYGRISVGPTPAGDPVVGLAHAERHARALARALPDRLQPARLQYRPELPAGTVTIEFWPTRTAADG